MVDDQSNGVSDTAFSGVEVSVRYSRPGCVYVRGGCRVGGELLGVGWGVGVDGDILCL